MATAINYQEMEYQEYERAAELRRARNDELHFLRGEVEELARRVAEKLNKEIAIGHETTAFMIAIMLAIAKDSLDVILVLTGFGVIPVIGALPGLFLGAVLYYFLWGKGYFLRSRLKFIWWIFGFFFDSLPLFNALPINTLMVFYAWHIVRKRATKAEKNLERLKEKTKEELNELDSEFE